MKIKRFIFALLAAAMLLAIMPFSAAAVGETGVSLTFTRDSTDPTKGTLTVVSQTPAPGLFIYTASVTPSATPLTQVSLQPYEVKPIPITGIPLSANFYITYCTIFTTQSQIATYTIPPYSASSVAVTIMSSSRSGNDVLVSLNVNEPCFFYYSDNSNMLNEQYLLLTTSTGFIPNAPLVGIQGDRVYYRTVTISGTQSEVRWFTVGGSGSGSVSNYPNLSSYYLYSNTSGYVTFSYTSDKSGYIYYVVSQTPVSYITPSPVNTLSISSGSGSFYLSAAEFTSPNAKLYFVTSDGIGSVSPVMSVALNSGSNATGYPNLTNCSVTLNSATTGTFNYTSDKTGIIYYAVSTSDLTSTSIILSGKNTQISAGTSSFTITDNNLAVSGAKVYYITVDNTGQYASNVQSVSVTSGNVGNYPRLTNVKFTVPTNNPTTGTFEFTSDSAGIIFYIATADTTTTKISITSYTFITAGSNTITISNTQSMLGMRLYYFTANLTTGTDSPLAYVFPNSSSSVGDAVISSVGIKNIVTPVTGAYPSYNFNVANDDTRYTVAYVDWYNAQNIKLSPSDKFQPGNQYSVVITLTAKTGYSFPANSSQFTAKVNDKSASIVNYSTGSVTFKYTFSIAANIDIKNVAVSGITEPVAGDRPDTSGIPGDNTYYVSSVEWLTKNSEPVAKFVTGELYTLNITLTPAAGYKFNVESAKIGTRSATITTKPADGSKVVITYKYWINPFKDVNEYDIEPSINNPDGIVNRYYVYIKYCYINELLFGTSATTFAPQATLTRGMYVTILGRLAGLNKDMYDPQKSEVNLKKLSKFKDVDPKSYYAPYVVWAVENGITQGRSDTTFEPGAPVTREEMCVFLRRYARYANIPLGYIERAIGFTDGSKVSSWAKEAVSIFEQAGVAVSRPNSLGFDPKESAQRQEVAEIIILFMMKYMNG